MEKIGVILTKNYKLLSVAAILEVFETVNQFKRAAGGENSFQLYLLTKDATAISKENAFGYPAVLFEDAPLLDLILIPAFTSENMQDTLQKNSTCIPHIVQQYQKGASIGTFCTGAFLLGASGLLNGKIATTHVDASKHFANAFPAVKLQADKTVTQDGRLYTSGGATSSFHLLLHLVQQYCGKEMAIKIAKVFAIDMGPRKSVLFQYFSAFERSS